MLCPICGKELPDKAKKCGNCGCRPQHLNGHSKPPKWIFATALALVVVLVAGVAALPLLPPPDPVADTTGETTPETVPETIPETKPVAPFWTLSLRNTAKTIAPSPIIEYSYDENGNLQSATHTETWLNTYGQQFRYFKMEFFYDEAGIFTGFAEMQDNIVTCLGNVSYDETQRRVQINITGTSGISQNITYQYDDQNQLISISSHNSYDQQSQWDLGYDEQGRLVGYTVKNGSAIVGIYTMQYGNDGRLISYTIDTNSPATVNCTVDALGNVLKEEYKAHLTTAYTYTAKTVSARTAWQYELQMYLLYMRSLKMEYAMLPIVKTPSNQGGNS